MLCTHNQIRKYVHYLNKILTKYDSKNEVPQETWKSNLKTWSQNFMKINEQFPAGHCPTLIPYWHIFSMLDNVQQTIWVYTIMSSTSPWTSHVCIDPQAICWTVSWELSGQKQHAGYYRGSM